MNDEVSLPPSSFITHPYCALCDQPIVAGEPTVPTTTGGFVHVTCADRDAKQAAKSRQRQVLLHGIGMVVVGTLLLWLAGPVWWATLLIMAGCVLHVRLHQLWWQ